MSHHSKESTLFFLVSYIAEASNQSRLSLSLMAIFDVSSAFDMEILLQRLQLSCGLSDIPFLGLNPTSPIACTVCPWRLSGLGINVGIIQDMVLQRLNWSGFWDLATTCQTRLLITDREIPGLHILFSYLCDLGVTLVPHVHRAYI